jgi:hypothetical protein
MAAPPIPQPKVVLLEEFTGLHCNNCPAAHDVVETILDTRPPGRVIAVTIHNDNSLSYAYSGEEELKTPAGDLISDLVGGTGAIPSGVVDRFDFNSDGTPIETKNKWPALVDTQLAEPTPVNVTVTVKSYDEVSRLLIANVKLHCTQTTAGDHHLSVMILESGIIRTQTLQDGSADPNYVHNRILRDMMSFSALGDNLGHTLVDSLVIEKDFAYTLADSWVAENCDVVAFVHKSSGFDIVQADSVHVQF